MAASPLPPLAPTASVTTSAPLSEGARIVNTFIAPSKTFTDLRRSAAWWAPFLLMAVVSTAFVYTVGQKIGFRKVAETQVQTSPKQSAQLDNLPADQREQQLQQRTAGTRIVSYFVPLFILVFWVIIAGALFATFKFVAGADVSFKISFAIVAFAGLPQALKSLLATIAVLAGVSGDSFSFQNPIATNPGFLLTPADSVFWYSVASAFDIFMIWTLVLTALGFTYVSKVKRGTAFVIVFGWWLMLTLIGAGLAAMFS
jgi:hypothetical protein